MPISQFPEWFWSASGKLWMTGGRTDGQNAMVLDKKPNCSRYLYILRLKQSSNGIASVSLSLGF